MYEKYEVFFTATNKVDIPGFWKESMKKCLLQITEAEIVQKVQFELLFFW